MASNPVTDKSGDKTTEELSDPNGQPMRQRLVVCLDGTWNKRSSGTNIYHLSNLVRAGKVEGDEADPKARRPWRQRIYYDAGVGTGVLDSATGGGFGLGLSENVIEAYDWLVERYHEGDEIYVFGFSRGAFTARSLVGLIGKCGLLKRGAPIPPSQVWEGYQLLCRHGNVRAGTEPMDNWLERLTGRKPTKPFRPLWSLKRESWEPQESLPAPLNLTEKLLLEWSRRVPIKCVGIFDTVGSLGLDALAIPGLRGKFALMHDMHFSSIIERGYHALAIDEHRANFTHTPWHKPLAAINPHQPRFTNPWSPGTAWDRGFEQRWFIGAHSNVGGSYEDDILAQAPLQWMIDRCTGLGLKFRAPRVATAGDADFHPLVRPTAGDGDVSGNRAPVRDSYAEFAGGFWQHIIRAKRRYRRLMPPAEMRAGQPAQSGHEVIDESVGRHLAADRAGGTGAAYNPPNLLPVWDALHLPDTVPAETPPHRHVTGVAGWAWLIVWLLAVGATAAFLTHAWLEPLVVWICAGVFAAAAWFVDWRESVANHLNTIHPGRRAGTAAPAENSKERPNLDAEKRRAQQDTWLTLRISATVLALLAPVLWLVQWCGGWRWIGELRVSTLWLFALAGIVAWLDAVMNWAAMPMREAGLASLVRLQARRNSTAVQHEIGRWIGRGELAGERDTPLLAPAARGLWRDSLNFVPAYLAVLFLGWWVCFSTAPIVLAMIADDAGWMRDLAGKTRAFGLLNLDWWTWTAAAGLALFAAIPDWIENATHLGYLALHPTPPPAGKVAAALRASLLKFLFFTAGLGAIVCAAVALAVLEVRAAWQGTQKGFAVLAVTAVVLALFSLAKDLWPRGGKTEARRHGPPSAPSAAADAVASPPPDQRA